MTQQISEAVLRAFALDVLCQAGMGREHAAVVADSLVYADLRGVSTHGVSRLGSYLQRVEVGVMEIDPEMQIVRESASTALLDAKNGFGQLAATLAMRLAIDKAGQTGIGAVSVSHSNHFGVAGYFAEIATKANRIGIVMTNASPAIAPHNTTVPLLGTNPLAIGVPSGDKPPVVLDMSSSLVARGKIRRAHLQGETKIPEGWAYDAQGHPTTDPAAALQGMLAPVGGAKGAGLSLVIDLLTGVLSGTGSTGSVANITDASRASGTGHLLIALDVAAFTGLSDFAQSVEDVVDRIHTLPSTDGGAVYVPGEIERRKEDAARESGIRLAPDVIADLRSMADRFQVDLQVTA
jgi:LDH2 family malate/lactate/ureidoglycolate dehydrogenase